VELFLAWIPTRTDNRPERYDVSGSLKIQHVCVIFGSFIGGDGPTVILIEDTWVARHADLFCGSLGNGALKTLSGSTTFYTALDHGGKAEWACDVG
jgi:hypothetical protein